MNFVDQKSIIKILIATVVLAMTIVAEAHNRNVEAWCNTRNSILNRAKERAMNQYSIHNFEAAMNIMRQGFRDAAADIDPYYDGALTAKAIVRAGDIADAVTEHAIGDPLQVKTVTSLLFDYVDFVEDVSMNLDIPYYGYEAPTRSRRHGRSYTRRGRNHRDYERQAVRFARQQVEMILDELAFEGSAPSWARRVSRKAAYPVGTPKGFFKAMELVALDAADDLSQNTYSHSYACVIRELDDLNATLEEYNRAPYGHEMGFFQEAYYWADSIVSGSMVDCGPRPYDYNDDYVYSDRVASTPYDYDYDYDYDDVTYSDPRHPRRGDVVVIQPHRSRQVHLIGPVYDPIIDAQDVTSFVHGSRNFKVKSGNSNSVSLGRQKFVRKVLVSARGLYGSVTLDVEVNGVVKGTYGLTTRSSNFWVDVNAMTDRVRFVSRSGKNIRINKVTIYESPLRFRY